MYPIVANMLELFKSTLTMTLVAPSRNLASDSTGDGRWKLAKK
jgi:hypothetical protein